MDAFFASLFLFLAIVTGTIALFRQARRRRPAEERLHSLQTDQVKGEGPSADLRRSHSSIPVIQRLLTNRAWTEDAALQLERAGLHLRVGEFLLIRGLAALSVFVVTVLVSRLQPAGVAIGLLLGVVAFWLPPLFVGWLARRRRAQIERQLVDLVPQLASSLRAGFAFQQALEVSSRQIEPPLADELRLLLGDVNLGATMQAALDDLGKRVGSPDLDMVITAILIQRTTGGNLSEVLDKTASTMSERERIRGDVMTLTAQQRLTGLILSVYPAVIGLLFLALMPHLWSKMFTEGFGQVLLGTAVGLQVIGFFAIRRLLDIEI